MRMPRCWMMRSAAPRRGHGGSASPRRRRAMSCWCPRRMGCGGCGRVRARSWREPLSPPSSPGPGRPSAMTTGPSSQRDGECRCGRVQRAARSGVGGVARAAVRHTRRAVPRLPHRRWPRCLAAAPSITMRWCARPSGATCGATRASVQRLALLRRIARSRARGFVTASAPSDWRIPRTALRMQRALIDGTADAARNARPAHADAITAWQEARLRQALRGRLAITIGHRDILALPPGG